jgi:clan AA aspartic protease (TIGR02281 family)
MTTYRPIRVLLPALAMVGALLTTGNVGAAAPGKCTLAKIAEWQVRPTRGQPIVDGTINGNKIGIMIDTGASSAIILRAAADRLGLVRHDAQGRRMIGIGGESNVETVLIDELAIGTDVHRNWSVLVAGEHEFGSDTALIVRRPNASVMRRNRAPRGPKAAGTGPEVTSRRPRRPQKDRLISRRAENPGERCAISRLTSLAA